MEMFLKLRKTLEEGTAQKTADGEVDLQNAAASTASKKDDEPNLQ